MSNIIKKFFWQQFYVKFAFESVALKSKNTNLKTFFLILEHRINFYYFQLNVTYYFHKKESFNAMCFNLCVVRKIKFTFFYSIKLIQRHFQIEYCHLFLLCTQRWCKIILWRSPNMKNKYFDHCGVQVIFLTKPEKKKDLFVLLVVKI